MSVELTDEEAKLLRGSKALMDQLLKSPKTRRQAEKLVKELYPDTQTTDDLAAPYVERLDKVEDKIDKFLKKVEEDKLDTRFNSDLEVLRGEGYTEEGITKIKEIMVKESIPNAIAASKLFDRQNPPKPQEPAGFQPTNWGIGAKTEDVDLKRLFDDPDGWADDEARKVWTEEQKKNRILT